MNRQSRERGVVMLDLAGPELAAGERALLGHPQVGGVILFARNHRNRAQLAGLVTAIRACNPALLIAVDQEGGRVQRLRSGFTRLPPASRFGEIRRQRGVAAARDAASEAGWLMASEVLAAGIDFSFAPVLDLAGDSRVIGDRAFAAEPVAAGALAAAFARGMHEAGMAATGKHFPGHGSVAADSHVVRVEDRRPLARIRERDLAVFRSCMGVLDAVMPAHVHYTQVDSHAAGFSHYWLQSVLRGRMGFRGPVFSDDLSMVGAGPGRGVEARADAALAAGCDMILVCNWPAGVRRVLDHLATRRQPPAAERLACMMARRRPDWPALTASPRWRLARQRMHRLIAGKPA